MATITTATFLDDGTARTAGETWSLNGGNLTIRTDTRVHIGAPAGFTGTFGQISTPTNYFGGTFIEGRNVREVWFDTGTGNVPAIGTTISQGGVEGYLLGVWPDLLSLPVVPGNAMPTSGFIKLREITGGNFAAGALIGIGANATGADTTSWIEIVQREAVVTNVVRTAFFRTRGTWYYSKDLTSGSANQIIQFPAMGSSNTHVPAVWIETAPGSDTYEIFPALSSIAFTSTNLGTDIRSKFVQTIGNAQVRIGHDGTTTAGFVPVAGCKIRIPNILGRGVASTNDALNVVPNTTLATRPRFTTSGGGNIDLEYFMADWWFNFATPNTFKANYVAWFESLNFTIPANAIEIDNCCSSIYSGMALSNYSLSITNGATGGTVRNSKFYRNSTTANQHVASFASAADFTVENCHFGNVDYSRAGSGAAIAATYVSNSDFANLNLLGGGIVCNGSNDLTFNDIDYCDRVKGNTNISGAILFFSCVAGTRRIVFDGLTFGFNGSVTDFVNPYTGVFNCASTDDVKIRNAGTRAAPLLCENTTNASGYIVATGATCFNHEYKRLYLNITRTTPFFDGNSAATYNVSLESVHGSVGTLVARSKNTLMKGMRAANANTGVVSNIIDSFAYDMFTSDTDGIIWFHFNEVSPLKSEYVTLYLVGEGGFNSNSQVLLPKTGDYIIVELPYFALGHTAFKNTDPIATLSLVSIASLSLEYDINTGSGFSGTYQALTGANLSAETLDPSVGVKLKVKITAIADNVGAIGNLQIFTESTLAAQTDNLYVLENATITISNLRASSRVQIYDTTNDIEIYNAIVGGTEVSYSAPYTGDYTARIRVMYATAVTADQFIEFETNVPVEGVVRSVLPEIDEIYVENGIDGFSVTGITINDSAMLVEAEDGSITWADIYAYETAWLYSAAGIRDEGRFITAIDQANYLFENFKIKNASSPSLPLFITGGWGRDASTNLSSTIIDPTGGTIFSNPDLVIALGGVLGLTPGEKAQIDSIDTITARLDGLIENVSGDRFTAKALEEGPVGESGGPGITASDVWTYNERRLTTNGINDIQSGLATSTNLLDATSDIITAIPTEEENAEAVRDELQLELSRIDMAISDIDLQPSNPWDELLVNNNTPGTFGAFIQKLLTLAKFLGLK